MSLWYPWMWETVFSDDQIAELEKRIDKSRKFCSVERNKRITEQLRSSSNGRSGDRLLKQ